ncbi:MAG: DUF1902 domain-containing protein [Phormidesmis sp. RL_2_1]|nr:DUF1902 domain-containing protein [Phormidesmis sp. RL_2_1]
MHQIVCKIGAVWDASAKVWTATSVDVPGLATEADTIEDLTQKLRVIVPELLQLNHVIPIDQASTVAIELTSHRQEWVEIAA